MGKRLLVSSTALSLSFLATAALAEPESPARGGEATTLETLVVTAQKREERLQDVPISISAFTAAQRDLVGIQTLQDIARFTPGMSFSKNTDSIMLRGVGRASLTVGSDPGVALYYDGVYQNFTLFAASPSFRTERVEVLRGPQGTLYGRNSIGGAVNIISKRPTEDFQVDFQQTIGNYETYITEARISGPISERIRASLAADYSHQGQGYIDNIGGADQGTRDNKSLDVQVEVDLAENLNLWLRYSVSDNRERPLGQALLDPYDTSANPFIGLVPSATFDYAIPNPAVANPFKNNVDVPGTIRDPIPVQNLFAHLDWDLGATTLKYIGGYTRYHQIAALDVDNASRTTYVMPAGPAACNPTRCPYPNGIPVSASNIITIDSNNESWSNELNLSSADTGRLIWILGAYQFGSNENVGTWFSNPGQIELKTPINGPANPDGRFVDIATKLKTRSYAVFGQAEYKLTDQITATVGLRYSSDKKDGLENLSILYFNPNAPISPLLPAESSFYFVNNASAIQSGRWEDYSGRLGLQWKPEPDTLVYGSYSRGYKSGGFNLGALSTTPPVGSETLNAYELGIKKSIGQFSLEAAAFYYDYRDQQIKLQYDQCAAAGLPPCRLYFQAFLNVPKSKSYGVDVVSRWAPTQQLDFFLSYSFLDATFGTFENVVDPTDAVNTGPQDLSGNTLQQSPRHKVTLNGVYHLDFEPGSLALSATYSWVDEQYNAPFNTKAHTLPAYSNVDLRATWTDAAKRYAIVGYVANARDTFSINTIAAAYTGGRLADVNPPRTYGVQLKYYFQ